VNTFVVAVLILVLIGIAKDVVVFVNFVEKWLRSRGNGDPKAPANLETLTNLLRAQSEVINTDIDNSFEKHFQPLLAENKRTNELLLRFLLAQKMIARANGLDLGDI
jgi:hypothetical protein